MFPAEGSASGLLQVSFQKCQHKQSKLHDSQLVAWLAVASMGEAIDDLWVFKVILIYYLIWLFPK